MMQQTAATTFLTTFQFGQFSEGTMAMTQQTAPTTFLTTFQFGQFSEGTMAMMQQTAATTFLTTFQFGNIRLEKQERLGSGAFGVVYKVQDPATSNFYALKSILCLNASALQNVVREAEMLKRISHPNIIAILGTEQVNGTQGSLHMWLLTEYCPGGNFNQRLPSPSTNQMNLKWMKQMADAIAYLHSHDVVHRDLKPDNVFLTATEDVKLGDFGLAREYIAFTQIQGYAQNISAPYYMQSEVGTEYYMAPEVFSIRGYSAKADVFGLGVLLYAILERDHVIIGGKAYYGAFVAIPNLPGRIGLGFAMETINPCFNVVFSSSPNYFGSLQMLIRQALNYDPQNRPTAQQVYQSLVAIEQRFNENCNTL